MDASIIIATYNRLWSLPDAIASCPQDDRVEVIVVDDGSTDGTWDWLATQPRIKAIRQSNWGKPNAVNRAIVQARGTYVRFLDSDDLLVADQVLEQLSFVVEQKADICVAGYWACYESTGERVLHDWQDCGDFLAQQLGECDSSHYSAFFFRRAFLADVWHRPEFAYRDDRMFILECALKEPAVVQWPIPTLLHRHHGRTRIQFQRGSTAVVTNWQELRMFEKVHAEMVERGLETKRRNVAMSTNLWALARRLAVFNTHEGRRTFRWLRSLNPDFKIPSTGISRLYRLFGFDLAQGVVNIARRLRDLFRSK